MLGLRRVPTAAMAPAGEHHSYGGKGPMEMAVTWILTIVATAAVGARVYVTFALLERRAWDLHWAVLAWVSIAYQREGRILMLLPAYRFVWSDPTDDCCVLWHWQPHRFTHSFGNCTSLEV